MVVVVTLSYHLQLSKTWEIIQFIDLERIFNLIEKIRKCDLFWRSTVLFDGFMFEALWQSYRVGWDQFDNLFPHLISHWYMVYVRTVTPNHQSIQIQIIIPLRRRSTIAFYGSRHTVHTVYLHNVNDAFTSTYQTNIVIIEVTTKPEIREIFSWRRFSLPKHNFNNFFTVWVGTFSGVGRYVGHTLRVRKSSSRKNWKTGLVATSTILHEMEIKRYGDQIIHHIWWYLRTLLKTQ